MKRPTFNNESSESQESQFIYKPSPKTVESTIISSDTDFDSQIENECSYEYLFLDSGMYYVCTIQTNHAHMFDYLQSRYEQPDITHLFTRHFLLTF